MGPHEDGCRRRGRLLSPSLSLSGSPREKNEDITMLRVVDVMSVSRPPRPSSRDRRCGFYVNRSAINWNQMPKRSALVRTTSTIDRLVMG